MLLLAKFYICTALEMWFLIDRDIVARLLWIESLQGGTASALAAVAAGHLENQQMAIEEGAVQ